MRIFIENLDEKQQILQNNDDFVQMKKYVVSLKNSNLSQENKKSDLTRDL